MEGKQDEPRRLSGSAVAIGEVFAILDAHAHRPGLLSFTRRAFAQAMPEDLAELEGDEHHPTRERIVSTTTRDSDVLIPYARLTVQVVDLEPKP